MAPDSYPSGNYVRPSFLSIGSVWFWVILALILLLAGGVYYYFYIYPSTGLLHTYHHMLMGTDVRLEFQCPSYQKAQQIKEQVFAEREELERIFSSRLEESELARVNGRAGQAPVKVKPELLQVVEQALYGSELTGGAFDPTVAPLLECWGFLDGQYNVPSPAELREALELVDYRLVKLDLEQETIFLEREGMALDLGGIAKGYIIDRALDILAENGIKHGFINAGGDIGILGGKPDGTPWRIGVRHPRDAEELVAVLNLSSGAVVTSGDYQRFFERGGQRYHHIIDPESGQPARQLISVTVTAPTAMQADMLSTAIFVLGPERGLKLVESLSGVEVFMVTPDQQTIASKGMKEIME
ncbi:MAG TPA: FAD:protein FMN transferase [Bacillota bacterium]|nr:FAD:protein FMN transferase [Bacillota bacterium]